MHNHNIAFLSSLSSIRDSERPSEAVLFAKAAPPARLYAECMQEDNAKFMQEVYAKFMQEDYAKFMQEDIAKFMHQKLCKVQIF